ncbi:MAG TPA: polyprenyl synthetase family protein [Polyangiaceae bacterium]|nr:polyprenyl synthetase family protein [Polyangiaceae bacterium]
MQETESMRGFLADVAAGVDRAIPGAGLDERHRDLLLATVRRFRRNGGLDPLADPVILFYLICRSERGSVDDAGRELAIFCHFYLSALDLLDDVQDADLAGKPHAQAGPAIALNSGLYLLFLGLAALERGMRRMQASTGAPPANEFLAIVARVGLLTGRGQYRDLDVEASYSSEAILDIAREKTASLVMICELAALYAVPEHDRRERYRRIGGHFASFVQVLDDLRDLFGKKHSPDLAGRRPNYALACFREYAGAEPRARLEALLSADPIPLDDVRQLLYAEGTVQHVARTLEGFRVGIHREVKALDAASPWLRTILFALDGLAATVYTPDPSPDGHESATPLRGFHALVRTHARAVFERLAAFGVPEAPRLVAWHLPHWLYDPSHGRIFYADIEGLPAETLPFQAALLGEPNLERVQSLVMAQIPAVVAHELFHYYRHHSGRLSSDAWLEELAANSLALAYCREFEADVLERTLALADRVFARHSSSLTPTANSILEGLTADPPRTPGHGYELAMDQMAIVQMGMIRHLARQEASLEISMDRWLGLAPCAMQA